MYLAIAVLAFGVLAGCSGSESSQSGDPSKQIDTKAKPVGPHPGMSVGGGGTSKPKAEPQ